MIRLQTHGQINKKAWDNCISKSPNGLVYSKSFFLDHMAPGWQGLILDDYKAVMPLTIRRKWGFRYLFQPAFFQQGGIYSESRVDGDVTIEFLKKAMEHFSFAEITLNYLNELPSMAGVKVQLRKNYIIDLSQSEKELEEGFSDSFQKNASRVSDLDFIYKATADFEGIIRLYRSLYGRRLTHFREEDYRRFGRLCSFMNNFGNILCREVINPQGQLLAAVLLLTDGNRLFNMISCLTPAGRTWEGNYYLYDKLIREFAGTGLILDLEGSDVKGIEDFYKRMDPDLQPYPFIRFNNLPGLVRLFKK